MSFAYLRLLIFLPAVLIPACASSSLAFCVMYSAYELNTQGDNIQPWCTPFPIWNQSVVSRLVLTVASWPAYRFLRRQVRWSCIPISWRIFHSLLWSTRWNPHNCSKIFCDSSPRVMEMKTNINKGAQIKSFCTAKGSINKMKRQLTEWEKIFANDTTSKGLIFKIHKQLISSVQPLSHLWLFVTPWTATRQASLCIKGFSVVGEAEVDVFLELSCFFGDPVDVGDLISGSSAFSKSSLNIWKCSVHILLKPGLENFEHYFASVWDECNCAVVWAFFGIVFLWDWNENGPFPFLLPLLSFPNLLAYWVQHFNSIIFWDLK